MYITCSWFFTGCPWLVHNLFMTWLWLYMFITYTLLVHELFMPWSQLVCDLFMILNLKFQGFIMLKTIWVFSRRQPVSKRGPVCQSICFSSLVERFYWHYKKATWDGGHENCRQPEKWRRPKNKDDLRNDDDLKNEKKAKNEVDLKNKTNSNKKTTSEWIKPQKCRHP